MLIVTSELGYQTDGVVYRKPEITEYGTQLIGPITNQYIHLQISHLDNKEVMGSTDGIKRHGHSTNQNISHS